MAHVATLVRNRIADDLALAVTDYFIDVGVVAAAAQGQASLRATQLDLHRALASFARSRRCPPILRYIIPGLDGELFAEPPQHRMADRREIYDQLEAEHAQHLASLAGFGDRAQKVCRSIELCVFMLPPDPADYPRPSLIAAALRIRAALEEDLRQLGEQSASMSDVEKLTAFGERLSKLRWKHAHCKNDGDLSAYRARGRPPTASPPSPVAEELRAWEREASRQWREAHSVMWSEIVMPLAQSCRDVGELAQKHRVGEDLVTLTVTAHRELVQRGIVWPNEAALKALASIEAGMDLLRVRVMADHAQPQGGLAPWPPPEHPTVNWPDLSAMEQDVVRVFLAAGEGAVMEVPLIASKARGVEKANRHDYAAASSLEANGILKKPATRTGRCLVALPRGMPPPNPPGAAEV